MLPILLSALLVGAGDAPSNNAKISLSGVVSTPENPVTCKKFKVTGSLVGRVKECRTATEWKKVADAARAVGQKMAYDNMGKPPGN